MRTLITILCILVAFAALAGATQNLWDRSYITAVVHLELAASDSGDVTPPIIGGDTLDVRGFMAGYCSPQSGRGYGLRIKYQQDELGTKYRWNEWQESAADNSGMQLTGSWAGFAGVNGLGMTPFMAVANTKLIRLFNPNTVASQSTTIIWFMDEGEAKAADWSAWSL